MRFRFSSHRSIVTFLHGDVLFTDPPAPSSAVIHLPKTFSSIRIFYAVIKQYMRSLSDAPLTPAAGLYRTYYMYQ